MRMGCGHFHQGMILMCILKLQHDSLRNISKKKQFQNTETKLFANCLHMTGYTNPQTQFVAFVHAFCMYPFE